PASTTFGSPVTGPATSSTAAASKGRCPRGSRRPGASRRKHRAAEGSEARPKPLDEYGLPRTRDEHVLLLSVHDQLIFSPRHAHLGLPLGTRQERNGHAPLGSWRQRSRNIGSPVLAIDRQIAHGWRQFDEHPRLGDRHFDRIAPSDEVIGIVRAAVILDLEVIGALWNRIELNLAPRLALRTVERAPTEGDTSVLRVRAPGGSHGDFEVDRRRGLTRSRDVDGHGRSVPCDDRYRNPVFVHSIEMELVVTRFEPLERYLAGLTELLRRFGSILDELHRHRVRRRTTVFRLDDDLQGSLLRRIRRCLRALSEELLIGTEELNRIVVPNM